MFKFTFICVFFTMALLMPIPDNNNTSINGFWDQPYTQFLQSKFIPENGKTFVVDDHESLNKEDESLNDGDIVKGDVSITTDNMPPGIDGYFDQPSTNEQQNQKDQTYGSHMDNLPKEESSKNVTSSQEDKPSYKWGSTIKEAKSGFGILQPLYQNQTNSSNIGFPSENLLLGNSFPSQDENPLNKVDRLTTFKDDVISHGKYLKEEMHNVTTSSESEYVVKGGLFYQDSQTNDSNIGYDLQIESMDPEEASQDDKLLTGEMLSSLPEKLNSETISKKDESNSVNEELHLQNSQSNNFHIGHTEDVKDKTSIGHESNYSFLQYFQKNETNGSNVSHSFANKSMETGKVSPYDILMTDEVLSHLLEKLNNGTIFKEDELHSINEELDLQNSQPNNFDIAHADDVKDETDYGFSQNLHKNLINGSNMELYFQNKSMDNEKVSIGDTLLTDKVLSRLSEEWNNGTISKEHGQLNNSYTGPAEDAKDGTSIEHESDFKFLIHLQKNETNGSNISHLQEELNNGTIFKEDESNFIKEDLLLQVGHLNISHIAHAHLKNETSRKHESDYDFLQRFHENQINGSNIDHSFQNNSMDTEKASQDEKLLTDEVLSRLSEELTNETIPIEEETNSVNKELLLEEGQSNNSHIGHAEDGKNDIQYLQRNKINGSNVAHAFANKSIETGKGFQAYKLMTDEVLKQLPGELNNETISKKDELNSINEELFHQDSELNISHMLHKEGVKQGTSIEHESNFRFLQYLYKNLINGSNIDHYFQNMSMETEKASEADKLLIEEVLSYLTNELANETIPKEDEINSANKKLLLEEGQSNNSHIGRAEDGKDGTSIGYESDFNFLQYLQRNKTNGSNLGHSFANKSIETGKAFQDDKLITDGELKHLLGELNNETISKKDELNFINEELFHQDSELNNSHILHKEGVRQGTSIGYESNFRFLQYLYKNLVNGSNIDHYFQNMSMEIEKASEADKLLIEEVLSYLSNELKNGTISKEDHSNSVNVELRHKHGQSNNSYIRPVEDNKDGTSRGHESDYVFLQYLDKQLINDSYKGFSFQNKSMDNEKDSHDYKLLTDEVLSHLQEDLNNTIQYSISKDETNSVNVELVHEEGQLNTSHIEHVEDGKDGTSLGPESDFGFLRYLQQNQKNGSNISFSSENKSLDSDKTCQIDRPLGKGKHATNLNNRITSQEEILEQKNKFDIVSPGTSEAKIHHENKSYFILPLPRQKEQFNGSNSATTVVTDEELSNDHELQEEWNNMTLPLTNESDLAKDELSSERDLPDQEGQTIFNDSPKYGNSNIVFTEEPLTKEFIFQAKLKNGSHIYCRPNDASEKGQKRIGFNIEYIPKNESLNGIKTFEDDKPKNVLFAEFNNGKNTQDRQTKICRIISPPKDKPLKLLRDYSPPQVVEPNLPVSKNVISASQEDDKSMNKVEEASQDHDNSINITTEEATLENDKSINKVEEATQGKDKSINKLEDGKPNMNTNKKMAKECPLPKNAKIYPPPFHIPDEFADGIQRKCKSRMEGMVSFFVRCLSNGNLYRIVEKNGKRISVSYILE